MSEEVDDGIKRKPAEDNPWYKFMQFTIKLDEDNDEEHGWHWFWGIYFLHLYSDTTGIPKFSLEDIQRKVSKLHWLKEISDTQYIDRPLDAPSSKFGKISGELAERNVITAFINCLKELKSPHQFDFSNLLFDKSVNFSNFIFPMNVSFAGSKFSKKANFSNATFSSIDNFTNMVFSHGVDFNNATFTAANFSDTKFYGLIGFSGVEFSSDAEFSRALFSGEVYFIGAKFISSNFDAAIFEALITFTNVNFSVEATFNSTIFLELASFESATFYTVNFNKTEFRHSAKFDGTTFAGRTNFSNSIFKNYTPHFYDANITANITWERDSNFWPQLKKHTDGEDEDDYKERLETNQNAYENLLSLMKKLDKYHDQHFFYRQEMQCRQKLEKNLFIRFPNTAYEWLANYGYGFGYALSWWFLHIVLGAIIIGAETRDALCAFPVSFANAHGFLFLNDGILIDCYDKFQKMTSFKVIWGIQKIAGIPLLFLVLLTLRIRFRLK